MMSLLWVVLFVALTGSHLGYGLPVRPTPQTYPHDGSTLEGWTPESGLYAAIPALALVFVAIAFLLGCTWCYRHKDCKPNEGADNQLFTASAPHVHTPQRLQPPDSGFSEPVNNNVSGEDNNNGPISLREMQNIANNNAGAYIFNENEERNANRFTNSRESIVLFDPLPVEIHVDDPLEPYSEWFTSEHFPRNNLQYLREVGRGWFGRVVASEIESEDGTQTVAVKILNQNASLEDKARFLEETRMYRELRHDQILKFLGKCLEEEPWLLLFELCTMDLQRYLIVNRPRMAILNESGVPLQLMSDVSSALSYMHSHGFTYGYLWGGSVLVRGHSEEARAVLGRYEVVEPQHDCFAPEVLRRGAIYTPRSEIWSLGTLIWEVCSWGSIPTGGRPSPPPELPCPYKSHLYQVMQLCWNLNPEERPTAAQVHALINHLHTTHALVRTNAEENAHSDLYASSDFEDRWQRLKPNSIPKVDEHIAIVHAPSTSTAHFTESDHGFENTLSVDMDTAVSRSSSIMSDKDPLESQIKSESLTNLHGSLEDVGNIYLTHNETAALECNQGNILEEAREKENDRSDSSVDPWLKEIIAGSQDDVSYYRDVSDVIKNLDNILNSEKTSSSESSHQASPSRDNLSLDCKKDYPVQSSMVKSPGISNFQNLLDTGFASKDDETENDDDLDRDTIGTLSHSFERHSDTMSQHTLENLTPDTPMKEFDVAVEVENQISVHDSVVEKPIEQNEELPNEIVDNEVPKLKELCVVSKPRLSEPIKEQLIVKDCETSCDSLRTDNEGTKSLVDVVNTESTPLDEIEITDSVQEQINPDEMQLIRNVQTKIDEIPSKSEESTKVEETQTSEDIRTETDETETDELKTETDDLRSKSEDQTKVDETQTKSEGVRTETDEIETGTDEILTETDEAQTKSEEIKPEENAILPVNKETSLEEIDTLPSVTEEVSNATEASQLKLDSFDEPETTESEHNYSKDETILVSDLVDIVTDSSKNQQDNKTESNLDIITAREPTPEIVQRQDEIEPIESKKDDMSPIDKKQEKIDSIETDIVDFFNETREPMDSKKELMNENQALIESMEEKVDLIHPQERVSPKVEKDTSIDVNQALIDFEILHLVDEKQKSTFSNEKNVVSINNIETIESNEADIVDVTDYVLDPINLKVTENQSMSVNQDVIDTNNGIYKTHEKVQSMSKNQDIIDSNNEIDKTHKTCIIQNKEGDLIIEKRDESTTPTDLPPALVQNTSNTEKLVDNENINAKNVDYKDDKAMSRSDSYVVIDVNEWSSDSTVYMDLINNTNSQILNSTVDNNEAFKYNKNVETTQNQDTPYDESTFRNESTVYMDLPSLEVIKKTDDFLHFERISNNHAKICASTPITSDNSVDTNTQDNSTKENETLVLSDTKRNDGHVTVIKEQKYVPESMSPFDSPTKSHPTDTFDENSSVVLGSFENCSLELFKGAKPTIDPVEIPREELLAFSSNFSEINLETPSPLRDGNFLNEVPDIIPDDNIFDDLASITEPKDEPPSDTDGSGPSGTERRVSPSTPPNSPGIFASTSAPKYVVDIDLNEPPPEPDSISLRDEMVLNQIELQITSKLAMAENENNLNIEYSGPLTVEGLIEEGGAMRENDEIPESILAGNGESLEDLRDNLSLDEECVKALRNELELKLPLAQVASIEPQLEGDGEWSSELPPPPELVVSYPGALSPIQEETGPQLSAYDNDIQWNPSIRTDSSESYPEPCNNSTDDVTELPTGNQEHTYTMPTRDNSQNNTYTVCKETAASSRDLTMSADSLNASPLKIKEATLSPIDDRTYNKEDEKESTCERISQESPFLVSPTTDTSAPDTSDNTRVSTSKTTLPTDAKHSKTETQCLSKATSIDSWCSNDTLYNVEENFDDLALEPDCAIEFERDEGNSDSTDTLHNDDVQELSHCSTYIIHDSKSENCETFSPDSITANDNYTYTKVKTEVLTTPSATDMNDSTKNTTKDLAYGTLMSGMPSFSNCTTEVASGMEDAWKLPELVRRSPIGDDVNLTPPKQVDEKECKDESDPKISEHRLKTMDSVEISCLQDNLTDTGQQEGNDMIVVNDSPNCNYRNMTPSVTSTPLIEIAVDGETEAIPMQLPEALENSNVGNVSSFRIFQQSAEVRPQDLSSNANNADDTKDNQILLEGESKTLSRNSNSLLASDRTPNYSDFEISAVLKPQDLNSRDRSSQSMGSGVSSEEFTQFENSVRNRPQDLSSLIDASSLLLRSERMSGELAMSSISGMHLASQSSSVQNDSPSSDNQTSQSILTEAAQSPMIPPITNLIESQDLVDVREPNLLINFGPEDETEQPHSIIVTEIPMNASKLSPNRTYDSHAESNFNHTFDSHQNSHVSKPSNLPKVNGEVNYEIDSLISIENSKIETIAEIETSPSKADSTVKETEPSISDSLTDKVPSKNDDTITEVQNLSNGSPQKQTNNAINEIVSNAISPQNKINNITDKIFSNENEIASNANEIVSNENEKPQQINDIKVNGSDVNIATVSFLNETFEELIESNVDDGDCKDDDPKSEPQTEIASPIENKTQKSDNEIAASPTEDSSVEKSMSEVKSNGESENSHKVVTEDFLQNEKNFCQHDSYIPLLGDIRFTGPATEIMSTSFSQESPTEPNSPECERDNKPSTAAELLKEWDSDSDSHSSNSSSGEFIWKDGDGRETSVVPTSHFDHQRGNTGSSPPDNAGQGPVEHGSTQGSVSGDSCSGSEGDEVEFVPSSWDCRAAPAKSSLRSLEQASLDAGEKKRVVFKRQKYHCVYEYPREALDAEPNSPAYLPDLSTYSEWDPSSVEEAELCYGHLYSMPSYPLRAGIAIGSDYDEDFFISSSARPFESLGIMSTTSQFFPGMHVKPMLERELPDDVEDFPPPPSPLPTTTLVQSRTPSLDFTTPDSGVEDITPGSTTDEDFKKKLPESELTWRPVDSASSSESVSPSSPGGESLGGLRHTRDKLKLDLPPSPHVPSPRHNRVFNFVLEKPKRRTEPTEVATPLVMTDETPIVTTNLPLAKDEELPVPEPTFSTFGKSVQKVEPEQKIILDEVDQTEVKDESPKVVEPVKGEGTVLDSGDEDSGIESSSKATLERKTNVS